MTHASLQSPIPAKFDVQIRLPGTRLQAFIVVIITFSDGGRNKKRSCDRGNWPIRNSFVAAFASASKLLSWEKEFFLFCGDHWYIILPSMCHCNGHVTAQRVSG